jgi:hypothetical protein
MPLKYKIELEGNILKITDQNIKATPVSVEGVCFSGVVADDKANDAKGSQHDGKHIPQRIAHIPPSGRWGANQKSFR